MATSEAAAVPAGSASDIGQRAVRFLRYVLFKLIGVVVVLLVVSAVTFLIFYVLPENPARTECGKFCSPSQLRQAEVFMGLNKSIVAQYLDFLGGIFGGRQFGSAGDVVKCGAPCIGYSFQQSKTVLSLVGQTFPVTLSIVVGGSVLWLVTGVGAGVISALRRGKPIDRAVMTGAVIGVSAPAFLVGTLLILFFSFKVKILPSGQYVPITQNVWQWAEHLILPWCTIAFISAAIYARLTRSQMLETLGEDYIRTARAKGLKERRVIGRHALRNVLIPIATVFGMDVGMALGGAVITEKIFSLYGLGALLLQSVGSEDLQVVAGITLLAAAFVAVANLIVDITYKLLDPRV